MPVHVILRRQDDAFCDPLELFGESALGTPGLTQAVRAGNVAVANALGSGLVETAATMAFLPGLCRALLGEELRMPSVATWWCGQPTEREYVIEHLEARAQADVPSPRAEVVFGEDLRAERAALVETDPRDAHQLHGAGARRALDRADRRRRGRDAASPRAARLRRAQRRRLRADAGRPHARVTVARQPGRVEPARRRQQGHLGARRRSGALHHADRPRDAAERRVARELRADEPRRRQPVLARPHERARRRGRAPVPLCAAPARRRAAARRRRAAARRARTARAHAAGRARPASAAPGQETATWTRASRRACSALFDRARIRAAAVAALHRIAWLLRDRISPDAWRTLARLEQDFVAPATHPALRVSEAIELLDGAIARIAAFTGIAMESMTRGLGWQFLDIGRRLERAIQIVALARGPSGRRDEPQRISNDARGGGQRDDLPLATRPRSRSRSCSTCCCRPRAAPRSLAFQFDQLEPLPGLPRAPRRDLTDLRDHLRRAARGLVEITGGGVAAPRARLDALLATCRGAALAERAQPRLSGTRLRSGGRRHRAVLA